MSTPPDFETSLANKETLVDLPTDVQPIAYWVAAGILASNVLLACLSWLFGQTPNFISFLIDAALVVGLFQGRLGARGLTLFRAYAGGILFTICAFTQNEPLSAAIITMIQLSYTGSLILLLQGATRTWKIWAGPIIFGVFGLGPSLLLFLLAFLAGL